MSAVLVRRALEVALAAMTPSVATAYENTKFTVPAATVPYQRVTLLLGQPANPEQGGNLHTEQGILQVDLAYPIAGNSGIDGAGPATTRAELLRSTFYRGASFTASGVTVTIERTPEILPGRVEADRFVIPVRIRFFAHIPRS